MTPNERIGLIVVTFICCGWPILANILARAAWKFFTSTDWKHIEWDRFIPWSHKDD